MYKPLLLFVIYATGIFAQFNGGSGTAGSPYQVATAVQLNSVRSYLTSYFIQTADIDLTTATASGGTYYNSGSGWLPIGNSSAGNATKFSGNYNGNGYKIIGLKINRTSSGQNGLFGATYYATLTNIVLTSGSISGGDEDGGLIGRSEYDNISGCSNSGTVSGGHWVGGLIGTYAYSTVGLTNCYASGNVSGSNSEVGGLVGLSYQATTISRCWASGNVTLTGIAQVGGLIGTNYMTLVDNSYALGNVTGTQKVGGLVGDNLSGGTISNSYSKGSVPASGTYIGGLAGNNANTISNCFWDIQTSGTATGIGGGNLSGATGKTIAEMKTTSTFTNAGWDLTTIWQIIGSNYPDLRNNQNSALPVELTSFSADLIDGKVLLNWKTTTEVNNYGFDVERASTSPGITTWQKIAFVQGHGNSNSPKNYSFSDASSLSGSILYRLKQIDFDGKYEYSSVIEVNVDAPVSFTLNQNYPNPFNPETTISYNLPVSGLVTLKVYDLLGSEITTLVNDIRPAGIHQVKFIGKDFSSGIYFYKIQCGSFTQTKKLMLLK